MLMSRRYQFSERELTELQALRKRNKDKNVEKRIKALLLYASGEKCEKIAEQTGYAKTYITELVSRYRKNGLSVIAGGNYGGNHRNLSFAEEEALLERFRQAAASGQMIEVKEIKLAYEKAIGRSIDKSRGQIYDVLRRHGWRKVKPRSKHPNKASEEEIESSKKLTQQSEARWEILQAEVSD
jgi:transposase